MRNTQSLTDVERLSELVKLAVDDARKLDRDAYWPDAGRWHEPKPKDRTYNEMVCHVCLGGAVIAGRGLADDYEDVTPGMVAAKGSRGDMARNDSIYNRLVALDSVRQGLYHSAARWMQEDTSIALDSRLDNALNRIREPRHAKFRNWDEFGRFLDDLESRVIPALRAAGI
ncbi:MAG: hypothetical protein OXC11_12175 [Rhodospirillales bacterium]|nr:hypothetical protein [Rhodospirillales bacterium]